MKTGNILTSVYCTFKINSKIKFIRLCYCASSAGRNIIIFNIQSDVICSLICTKQKKNKYQLHL